MLLVQNLNAIYQLNDFDSEKKTVLLQKENIYLIIMHVDELLVCTLDDYGLMEIYIYDFASKKSTKIANANSTPHDFNKEYIFCGDEGAGIPELINRRTGDALLKTITEYYQKKFSWKIIDYRIADNDHSLYQLYEDYELGNVVVFEVHTTNNPSGLYRAIVLGRKNDNTEWEVLNEGV